MGVTPRPMRQFHASWLFGFSQENGPEMLSRGQRSAWERPRKAWNWPHRAHFSEALMTGVCSDRSCALNSAAKVSLPEFALRGELFSCSFASDCLLILLNFFCKLLLWRFILLKAVWPSMLLPSFHKTKIFSSSSVGLGANYFYWTT